MLFKRKETNKITSNLTDNSLLGNEQYFICPHTGRHILDTIYEIFAKPQLQIQKVSQPDEPSIYIRHQEGQILTGNYQIERVFEDAPTGFYAEGRIPLTGTQPPVLVIRGYGSWYPFERVLEDTPDVFLAHIQRQFKAAEKTKVIEWLKSWGEKGKKPDIIGESLGGKVAQQIAANYPELMRSTVTFNSLGVAPEIAQKSQAKNVFHYFTLGERYAFWANRGDYIPGRVFQISRGGKTCRYKLEERIIKIAKFPVKRSKRVFFLMALAQLILLNRHNAVILNTRSPVVIPIELEQLRAILTQTSSK